LESLVEPKSILRKPALKLACFFLSLFVVALNARAQVSNLKVTGIVLDPSGIALAVAKVAFDLSSGARLATTADSEGRFSLLPPASREYTAHVQAPGFSSSRRIQLERILS
jgi:hypothetical protein